MSGSLSRGGGENVPGIPGACATRDFAVSGKRPMLIFQITIQPGTAFTYIDQLNQRQDYHSMCK